MTLPEEIGPAYCNEFIYIDRHKKCMYAGANKTIYGNLEALLLFWTKLSKTPEEMVYQRNEYDWCVMKKMSKVKNVPYYGMLKN